jgi:hypothetical protein
MFSRSTNRVEDLTKDAVNGALSLRHLTCLALRLPQSHEAPNGENGGENTRPETDSTLEEDF